MDSPHITPEPDETERRAILEALAAEQAERSTRSGWAETLLPACGGEDAEP